jgi:hypothetical protein
MRRLGPTLVVLVCLIGALPQALAAEPLLNSERIEQTFGSYGIDVVYSDDELRLSNLHSLEDGRKITRTFAIVAYPKVVQPAFEAEHEAILAGGSIGATFKAAGWDVIKTDHRYAILSPVWPELARLMHIGEDARVAMDMYRLSVVRGDRRFDYARIIEIHHPDYLGRGALEQIYGAPSAPQFDADTGNIFNRSETLLRELELPLSE